MPLGASQLYRWFRRRRVYSHGAGRAARADLDLTRHVLRKPIIIVIQGLLGHTNEN